VASQVEYAAAASAMVQVFLPFKRDMQNGYAGAVQMPLRRQVHVRPRDGPVTRVETAGKANRHVDAVAWWS
jgi:hypothetical protein